MAARRVRWDRAKGVPEPILALDRMPEKECGEPLVSLHELAPSVRLVRPQMIPYCRKTVAEMVQRAASSLPSGVFLEVTDAWRPFLRQQLIYESMTRFAREAFPDLTFGSLRRKVNRWVAPPHSKSPPGHCTGGALDVMLVSESGDPIDVTSPFNRFEAAPTYALGLVPEAQRNRETLVAAMLGAGFSNCRDEWWHYSYGDAGWAVRLGKSECFYGLVELPEEMWGAKQEEWLRVLRERKNPFLAEE